MWGLGIGDKKNTTFSPYPLNSPPCCKVKTNFTILRVITMTNLPPSEPESSQKSALGFDEFIAILVSFLTLGGILFWSISRNDSGWDFQLLPDISPTVEPDPASSSPVSGLQPNMDYHYLTSSRTDVNVNQPRRNNFPLFSFVNQVFNKSSNSQENFEQFLQSSSLPLVAPAENKSIIPPPVAFDDVPTDFWAGQSIDVLSSRGIISGFPDNSFRPHQPVSRAEFAAILQQAFHQQSTNAPISFKDVAAKSWATPAIEEAVGTGFLTGYPDQTFQPEAEVPRVQVLVALVNGLNLPEIDEPSQVLNFYADAEAIPQYATKKIAVATTNELVFNYPEPNILAPNQPVTRAEVAVVIHKALALKGRVESIQFQNYPRLIN